MVMDGQGLPSYIQAQRCLVDDGQTNSISFDTICLAVKRVDDGQTNSVLFYLSVWPSSVVPRQQTDDGLTTGRRISVWPSSVVPRQQTDYGLTTADEICSFSLICLAIKLRSETYLLSAQQPLP
jgi:hypothetical protein